jgi:FK506-binding nuclear protein
MPVAVALWSVSEFPPRVYTLNMHVRSSVVKPGKAVSVIPQGDLVITNAALGTELADSTGRTSVKLTYMRPVKVADEDEDDEEIEDGKDEDEDAQVETVLCSFTPGKVLYMYP